jgi:antitoxin component YwqK of YwqJK toxin-antitoxin module
MKRLIFNERIASGCIALAMAAGLNSAAVAKETGRAPAEFAYVAELEPTVSSEVKAEPGVNGEVELVRERYLDGKVRIERQVTLNGDGNYVNHGSWKQFSEKGEVIAEGQYNFGQRVGMWTRWLGRNDSPIFKEFPFDKFKAPFMSQVTFVDGKMDGDWIIADVNEHKILVTSLKAGERTGSSTTWLPNGKVYRQASYNQSVPVGDLLELNPKTGQLAKVATYEEGRKVVTTTTYFPGNKRQKQSETMYLAAKTVVETPDDFWSARLAKFASEGSDLKNGTAKTWYANGKQESDGYYVLGQKSGTFTYWHENGQVASTGEYKDDLAEGTWVWWHDNGQKSAVGKYEKGTLIGDWRWWDSEGKLTKQQTYDGTESASTQPEERMDVSKRPTKTKISRR